MRRSLVAFLALAVGVSLAAGCGAKTVINTAPMSDEAKRLSQEEDRKVADEESGGHAGKTKKGGR